MKKTNKILAIIMLVLIIANVIGFATYGIYTSVTKVKRVVSTQGGQGDLFSSNLLSLKTNDIIGNQGFTYTNVNVNYTEGNPSYNLTVCNYAQGNASKYNKKTITYTIKFTIVTNEGATVTSGGTYGELSGSDVIRSFSVGDVDFTNASLTLSNQTLAGGAINRNIYKISFNKDYISQFRIKVLATPISGSDYSEYSLEGVLIGMLASESQAASWTCTMVESSTDEANVSNVYGFNYDISGDGSGVVTITWNKTYLEISEYSLTNVLNKEESDVIIGSSSKSVKVNVTSGSYRIQFYRTGNIKEDETWQDVIGYVTVSFKAS